MNIGSCNLSSNSRSNAGTSNPARQSDFISSRLPSRVCKPVCWLLLLLSVLLSLQRSSCVAGAEGEAERARWSFSFDDYRRSFDSSKFLECESSGVLPEISYDAERDQSGEVHGGMDLKLHSHFQTFLSTILSWGYERVSSRPRFSFLIRRGLGCRP